MDEYVNITLSIRSLCRYLVVGVFVAKVWQDVVSRDQLYKNVGYITNNERMLRNYDVYHSRFNITDI